MMDTNLYRATFDTKKAGDKHWVIDLEAKNKKEAREILEYNWSRENNNMHMFHIEIRRLRDDEEFKYNWFKSRNADTVYLAGVAFKLPKA